MSLNFAAPKGVSKRMGYRNGKFLSFENLTFWYPFVLVPVCFASNGLRSSARDPTIKAVRETVAVNGIFDNSKGLGSCYGGVHSPYRAIGSLTAGSVPLTGLF